MQLHCNASSRDRNASASPTIKDKKGVLRTSAMRADRREAALLICRERAVVVLKARSIDS